MNWHYLTRRSAAKTSLTCIRPHWKKWRGPNEITPAEVVHTNPWPLPAVEYFVGVGGRVTIPQDMREDLGIDEGDSLTVRVEENPRGGRQMVVWRAALQPQDE